MVNNSINLGPYQASDSVERTFTKTYNTGDSTHVYIAAAYPFGQSCNNGEPLIAGYFQYPQVAMSINGSQKFSFDNTPISQGNLVNFYYEVPKNSTITFTVKTFHTKESSLGYEQGYKLINFLIF